MCFDVAGIHRHRSVHAGRSGQGVKNIRPNPLPAPAVEAVVDRRVGAIDFRAIAPARTRFQHVHNAADHASIIDPMRSLAPSWQQRLNPPPFRIAEPVDLLCHSSLPSAEKLESHSNSRWNPYWVQTLELERLLKTEHEDGLRAIRRRAHKIAEAVEAISELKTLDDLIGTFLRTRETKLVHDKVAARQRRDSPFDPDCMERLKELAVVLNRSPLPDRPDPHVAPDERACASFVEAYFTNFIEGTRFSVEKARRIVFENEEPDGRPADGRDIVQTFRQVSSMAKGMQTASSYQQFEDEIRGRNRILLDGGPEKDPGNFKTEPNSAGNTQFVLPDLVIGTLKEGYETLGSLTHPLARGIFVHTLLVLVHPFNDGNGRTSRIMMTKELVGGGQSRIIVPSVFRTDYINGIKSLVASPKFSPAPLIRALLEAQRVTAAIASPDLDKTIDLWASTHAFVDDDERDAKLTFPNANIKIERRNGIPAPESYWEAVDLRNSLGDDVAAFGKSL